MSKLSKLAQNNGEMIKILKVEQMFYVEDDNEASTSTGLYILLENGDVLRHQSTDYIMPFEKPKPGSEIVHYINSEIKWRK